MRFLIIALALALAGCTSTPTAPTPRQQMVAEAIEDLISVGLVPVLSKNTNYLPVARGIAAALGSFNGTSLLAEDVDAFLAQTAMGEEDKRAIAGIVNAAWAAYQKRYAQQVGASVRPDVKLFLAAVSNGIEAAIAAVPK